ncbi:hypothetical protein J437_LFUL011790 [Ladona fulva]|uniref:Major facilitator superfamily (MFS) profile domain-containing protein n=1 Tax=Ladona fulva TaxID=123851 RepID=A0A8K0P3Z0_LADFU|nr:hypothetical protein J437_LFUL011790 [Ladona fulva]
MWSLAGDVRDGAMSPPLIEVSLSEIGKGTVEPPPEVPKKPLWNRMIKSVAEFFDLKLLADPRFLMIFIGVTFAFAGEVNFTLLTPFVLAEKGLSTDKMALVMSILATLDLITRFTIPFLSDKYRLDSRLMYSVGLAILASGRISKFFQTKHRP